MDEETTFDPALVDRLSRPATRPGVVDHDQTRTMLARHRGMVAELPLAELVSRHAGSMAELAGAGVPIVYAQPARPAQPASVPGGGFGAAPQDPSVSTSDSGFDAAGPAPSGPVVVARPARPAAGAAAPSSLLTAAHLAGGIPGPVTGTAVPAGHPVVTPIPTTTPVVQRKVAAPPAPATSPPDHVGPVLPSRPSTPDPPVPRDRGPNGTAPGPTPPPRSPGRAGSPLPVPAVPAEPGGSPSPSADPVALPLVVARPAPSAAARRSAATEPTVTATKPTTEPTAEPAVVSARQPHPRPGEPLLLVDLAAASTPPGRESPVAAGPSSWDWAVPGRSVAGTTHAPASGRDAAASTARHTRSAAQPGRQEDAPAGAPVDIGHIVDLVHNRFVRRLAVEAERRGVR